MGWGIQLTLASGKWAGELGREGKLNRIPFSGYDEIKWNQNVLHHIDATN